MSQFEKINKGFNNIFQFGKLSVGLVIPLENYALSSIPTMKKHIERVILVEKLNFKAIWVRDVPFHVPSLVQQEKDITKWRELIAESQSYSKPFLQPLYIDLQENPDYKPKGIHLGFRIGTNYLIEYFKRLESIGVNHVALNLRFNSLGTEKTLDILAEKVLPNFNLS